PLPCDPAENYERLEADKKRQVLKKRPCGGATIRFHSLSVPMVTEGSLKEETVDVEGLDQEPQPPVDQPPAGRCLRNFVTFSDEATFERCFPRSRPARPPIRELCPVTHKPALYRDPVTDIPYASTRAFKIIREAYKKYVSAHGLPGTAVANATANAAAAGHGAAAGAQDQAARNRQRIIIKQATTPT
ncbi:vacuolar protein sorting-associated protein 72 homolog, partial [Amblyraja radiata]|uniref:vacuolar protein sorting-associated protein 72 homolog n=1 Tax=Amblyraja radiata TaxID=386614 RepID=UPI001402905D